jgi:ATP-dependent Clp protease ATP-binding subunit ClpB
MFHLSQDDLAQIVELSVDALQRRLRDRRLTLAVTPDARGVARRARVRPDLRARPLRLIQSEIQDRSRWRCSRAACTTATSCASTSPPTARASCSPAPERPDEAADARHPDDDVIEAELLDD